MSTYLDGALILAQGLVELGDPPPSAEAAHGYAVGYVTGLVCSTWERMDAEQQAAWLAEHEHCACAERLRAWLLAGAHLEERQP
jgi:hypothetical protein